MSGGQQGGLLHLDGVLHVDELGEQLQAPALLHFIGVNKWGVIGAALVLGVHLIARAVPEVGVQHDAGDLPLLAEGVDGQRNHIVLAVAVDDDDFAEARVPEARQHIGDVVGKNLLRDHDGALLAQVMIGVRAIPDGLGHSGAGALGHQLAQAGIQIGVLAVGGGGAVVLGGADGQQQHVVLLQPLLHHFGGHILVIDAVLLFHVAAGGGQIPIRH